MVELTISREPVVTRDGVPAWFCIACHQNTAERPYPCPDGPHTDLFVCTNCGHRWKQWHEEKPYATKYERANEVPR